MTSMNEFFHYKKNHNEYIHTNFESLGRPSQDQMYNQPNRVDKELAKTNTEIISKKKLVIVPSSVVLLIMKSSYKKGKTCL